MLFTSFSAVAALALAAQATAAELKPYKPQLMKMSVHQMFGIGRRQASGYQPTQSQCGTGATCAEACGAGYETCTSSDNAVHCFNPAAAETCCPDSTGSKSTHCAHPQSYLPPLPSTSFAPYEPGMRKKRGWSRGVR